VSLILVIGGTGGFGARLCRRLAVARHGLLVAGRNGDRAAAFAATLPDARALAMDRGGDVAALLAAHRPDLVIDAAGPFQASSYAVPQACIAAGIPYLDLADARDFVSGIVSLDEAARQAGVAIVAGASSVSALSGAVVRKLAERLDRVETVDMALSAASRRSGGESIVRAALSYVGRPVLLWRAGRWSHGHGWQEMVRASFLFRDGSGLRGRLAAIADVPDLDLLPAMLPGRPSVTFRGGTESGLQMGALWLASWPVRCGWLKSLAGAAPLLVRLYRLTAGFGGARSAMKIVLRGRAGALMVERSWTVVAEKGEGLEIPTLGAALLAEDALAGRLAPGARSAASLLTLDRFEPAFAALALRHEIDERELPPPLYARILGSAFDALPPAVRGLHDLCGDAGAAGEGTVMRGRGPLARLVATLMRFPPAGTWPLRLAFTDRNGVEAWTRDFGGHAFSSALCAARDGLIVERFGSLRFAFALPAGPEGLEMRLRRWSVFRLPLPRFLAPRISAREWQDDQGRFRFDVAVALPLIGDVIGYWGWLELAEKRGNPVVIASGAKQSSAERMAPQDWIAASRRSSQ
jgi:NAD(P)-dependent dehydrogenase (short-subunit alcohol dehydrogenase family)